MRSKPYVLGGHVPQARISAWDPKKGDIAATDIIEVFSSKYLTPFSGAVAVFDDGDILLNGLAPARP